eukprot:13991522-Ditylum_brightwellii.AAC.1
MISIPKFKYSSLEEVINRQIQMNHVIQNTPCREPKRKLDIEEVLFAGKPLQQWRQFKSQVEGLLILGVVDGEDKDKARSEGI